MANFINIEKTTTFHVIFGWPLLSTFRIVVSTYHVAINFSIGGEEITFKGDFTQLRAFYIWENGDSPREEEVLKL